MTEQQIRDYLRRLYLCLWAEVPRKVADWTFLCEEMSGSLYLATSDRAVYCNPWWFIYAAAESLIDEHKVIPFEIMNSDGETIQEALVPFALSFEMSADIAAYFAELEKFVATL